MCILLVSIFYWSDALSVSGEENGESTSNRIFGLSSSKLIHDNGDNETQGFYSICASEFKPYFDDNLNSGFNTCIRFNVFNASCIWNG